MATQGAFVPTLVDLTNRLDPGGKLAEIAEILNAQNEVLQDMTWREGNLPTGERTTLRTSLPGVAFRRLNEGVPVSKAGTTQVEEGAAMLEAFSQVDRKLAVLSGNPARFRLDEAKAVHGEHEPAHGADPVLRQRPHLRSGVHRPVPALQQPVRRHRRQRAGRGRLGRAPPLDLAGLVVHHVDHRYLSEGHHRWPEPHRRDHQQGGGRGRLRHRRRAQGRQRQPVHGLHGTTTSGTAACP
jgi:hypothetical protein